VGKGPGFALNAADHFSDESSGWLHDALSKYSGNDFQLSSSCSEAPFWHDPSVTNNEDPCLEVSFFGENLNSASSPPEKGIFWYSFGGPTNSLTELKLSVRPVRPRRKVSGTSNAVLNFKEK